MRFCFSDFSEASLACSAVCWAWSWVSCACRLDSFELWGETRIAQSKGDDQGAGSDHQRHAVLADGVHFRLAFLSRLALGVTEMENGNEMVESGFTTVRSL